jgi:hypothetical protein
MALQEILKKQHPRHDISGLVALSLIAEIGGVCEIFGEKTF